MNLLKLIQRVRSLTRDLSNSIFREIDIVDYLNEGIQRIRQNIPELRGMVELTSSDEIPSLLPSQYHHLLPLYSASRCFGQDERHYQATNFMNEFETKLEELKNQIEDGQVVIVDGTGNPVTFTYEADYVVDNYFSKRTSHVDIDKGVEEE